MAESRSLRHTIGIGAALLMLAVMPMAPTIWHGFLVYDDNLYVTENPIVQRGITIEGIHWAFTTFDASNWHPLTWLSHMLDCTMFRRADGTQWPGGHHLINVVLHGINTLLLWIVLRRLTGAFWRSAMVAALFAVHPLHVESIAWIAERKDVLSTMFGLLAIGCYERWVRKRSHAAYGVMLGCFAMSLLAKPMLVTLPFLLLLLDVWPLRRLGRLESKNDLTTARSTRNSSRSSSHTSMASIVIEKIPLFVLAAASCVMTMLAQRSGGALASFEGWPTSVRLFNAVVAYAMYLTKTVWPLDLAVLYPLPLGGYWPAWRVAASAGLLITMTIAAVALCRKRPAMLIGWLWFLGMLVPVVGLVQVGMQSMADRYTYVPLVGVFIMIAWALPTMTAGARRASAAAASLVVAFLAAMTVVQVGYWRDDFTLFKHTLKVTTNNFIAHNNLGHAFARANQLDDAIREFNKSVAIKADHAPAQENLGNMMMRTGHPAAAIPHFEAAHRKTPGVPRLVASLGDALVAAGRVDDAIAVYRQALDSGSGSAGIHAGLAIALARKNQLDAAISEYQLALALNSDDAVVHANFGLALASQGRLDEAILHFQEALRLKPDFEMARVYLKTAMEHHSERIR